MLQYLFLRELFDISLFHKKSQYFGEVLYSLNAKQLSTLESN